MVNVFVTKELVQVAPKSLLLLNEGDVAPSAIETPFPLMSISTEGATEVVNPFTTLPGLTQLEAAPVNPKLVSVPVLLLPEASVKSVVVRLLSPAEPWLKW